MNYLSNPSLASSAARCTRPGDETETETDKNSKILLKSSNLEDIVKNQDECMMCIGAGHVFSPMRDVTQVPNGRTWGVPSWGVGTGSPASLWDRGRATLCLEVRTRRLSRGQGYERNANCQAKCHNLQAHDTNEHHSGKTLLFSQLMLHI